MLSKEETKGKILHKLARKGKFKASHTAVTNLSKGFPKHMVGEVNETIKDMKRQNLLIVKPTSYGEQVSINLNQHSEILRLIQVFLKSKKQLGLS